MITVSWAALICWISGSFVVGIAYGRWRLAKALANRKWLEENDCQTPEEDSGQSTTTTKKEQE